MSASLGQMLIALHRALLHSVQSERDPLVLAATLRALGTLLLGAPYHRLPLQLLPLCVQALLGCLAKTTPAPPAGPAGLVPEQLPIVSACLSCMAAAFSSKAAGASLIELTPAGGSSEAGGEQQQLLLQLLFSYAACQHVALQLEAMMALRGVAQQHAAQLDAHWARLLAIARAGAALHTGPQPPRSQGGEDAPGRCCTCHVAFTSNAELHLCVTSAAELVLLVLVVVRNRSVWLLLPPALAADGTLPEKVAQQSVRLAGDYLEASAAAAAQLDAPTTLAVAAQADQWQQVAAQVLQPATWHASPLLRAAAQAIIGALSPAVLAGLPATLQQQLLAWCCSALAADEASPVRAAAAKAAGALAGAPALCALPEGRQA